MTQQIRVTSSGHDVDNYGKHDKTTCRYCQALNVINLPVKHDKEKVKFDTGATRETKKGKGRFDLLPFHGITRVAHVMEKGATHHGDRNWEKGIPLASYIDSALRHISQYMQGMKDEDHIGQAAWNLLCLMCTEEWIRTGRLPESLNNLPKYD